MIIDPQARSLARRAGLALLLTFAGLLASACSDDPAPAEIRFSPVALSFDALGDTAGITATVFDEDGKEMRNRRVEWSSGGSSVATVDPAGVVTAVGPGTASILATAGKASGSVQVTVAPTVTRLEPVSNPVLSGVAGDPLPAPLIVRALDRRGSLIPGAILEASVDAGEGSLNPETLTTDAAGQASVVWTLGPVAGGLHQARVYSSADTAVRVFFLASALPGPPARVDAVAGTDQVGLPGAVLPQLVRIRVVDRQGNARSDQPVEFQVTAGGGTLDRSGGVTDASGEAEVQWTLGAESGEQRLQVVSGAVSTEVLASAVTGPANLELVSGPGGPVPVTLDVANPVVIRLSDAAGTPVQGLPVRFRVTSGGGTLSASAGGDPLNEISVETDAQGLAGPGVWTLGSDAGTQELEASFPGLPALAVSVVAEAGPPALLTAQSGDRQTAVIQEPLSQPVILRVEDAHGNPVPGLGLDVQVAEGAGSVSLRQPSTSSDGTVAADWTLGPVIGLQSLVVSTPGVEPLGIIAAGLQAYNSGYSVEIQFVTEVSPSIWAAFQVAGHRWSGVITGDLPDVLSDVDPGTCGNGSPAVRRVVDDVLILATIEPIDGPGGTLGSAGPCWIRDDSDLPFLGRMRLDTDDLVRMQERGQLQDVIVHEVGHILGIGTLWRRFDLLQLSARDNPGSDTYFSGAAAIQAFDATGGVSYTGNKVPVENTQGGAGTLDSHWRESVMDRELMTGFVDASPNPLSIVTAASLQDLGYVVDQDGADSYSLAPARVDQPREEIELVNDVLVLPLRTAPPIRR
jgi:hypothetical protein